MNLSKLLKVGIALILAGVLVLERENAIEAAERSARIKQCEQSTKMFLGPLVPVKCVIEDGHLFIKLQNPLTGEGITYDEQGKRVD